MLYYTRVYPDPAYANTAMPKADEDFAYFMTELGGRELLLQVTDDLRVKFADLRVGDIVVYQHPTFKCLNFEQQIIENIRAHGAVLIIFVNDALSLRNEQIPRNNVEIELFNQADCLVVHTEAMVTRLKSFGVTAELFAQGLFPYRVTQALSVGRQDSDFRKLTMPVIYGNPTLC